MRNIEAFVTTYQSLFPGTPTPSMPSKPEDLSFSVQLAIRENNPRLWQAMFGGHGAPLPADVAMRVAKGEIAPEDVAPLRAANYDDWAAQANQIREESLSVLVKTLVNERKLSTKQSEHVLRSSSRKVCWSVSLHHHCQPKQSLKHVSSGESLVADDSSVCTNARRT